MTTINKPLILFVDDEASIRETVQMFLAYIPTLVGLL